MPKPSDCSEGVIQYAAADRVINPIEAASPGQASDICVHRLRTVDEAGTETPDCRTVGRRACREYVCAAYPGDLNRHPAPPRRPPAPVRCDLRRPPCDRPGPPRPVSVRACGGDSACVPMWSG